MVRSAGIRFADRSSPYPKTLADLNEQGMGAQILKAVLSQGVLFMSKDQFERWAVLVIAALYRVNFS
jgi:hypothetical protein